MGICKLCNSASKFISKEIAVCLKCIREKADDALQIAMKAHVKSRKFFELPEQPPKDPDGISCKICVNECRIPPQAVGYCGIRRNEEGKLIGGSSEKGNLSWYYDPLPTNCVADWVCAAGTGAGYPEFAYTQGAEYGYKNLAVFFHACSFNCLYCQNWHFRKKTFHPEEITTYEFSQIVDETTSCICYFGGDPSTQLPFAIKSSKIALKNKKGRILRICWETNGTMNKNLLDEIITLSTDSGGCIKFDLKAWDENLHKVLTGVTNKRTLENFARVAENFNKRRQPPLLVASTLLVSGYIDEDEVRNISKFIASLNP